MKYKCETYLHTHHMYIFLFFFYLHSSICLIFFFYYFAISLCYFHIFLSIFFSSLCFVLVHVIHFFLFIILFKGRCCYCYVVCVKVIYVCLGEIVTHYTSNSNPFVIIPLARFSCFLHFTFFFF